MLKRLQYRFATTADKALASLDDVVAANPGFAMAVDASGRIKVYRNQGFALMNGFFPVFVGRFSAGESGAVLLGGFRFHLLAIALFAAFVGTSLFSLIDLLTSAEPQATLPENWKSQRIRFELQFVVFALLCALFAWLAGRPMRERMQSMIEGAVSRHSREHPDGD